MNADLHDALIAWQSGDLPAGRGDELLERLRRDAEFRKALAEQVWTLSLGRVAQSPDPRWLALHEEIGLLAASTTEQRTRFEQTLMTTVRREPQRWVSARWRGVAAAAAAAVLILSVTLWFEHRESSASAQETLAVLVPGAEAVWKRPRLASSQSSRSIGAEPLQLLRGHARLLFTSGVVMDIEGPAELQLLSVSRVLCREGRLRTQVPKGAEGFCVETPRGAVTDLGTELGISVSRQGATDVAVFEGQAELSVQIPGQEGLRTALLNVHEKARFQSQGGEIRAGSEATFLESVTLAPPALPMAADYADRLRAAKPVHHWRLNRQEAGTIPNEIADGPPLLMAGAVRIEPDAHGHASAVFAGHRQPGMLHLAEPWRTPAEAYALEFWFLADTLEQMALAALTTAEADRPHLALVEIGGRRPGEGSGAGILRYLLRWPPGHRDGLNLYTPRVAALPYQWHHVVAQQRAGRMQLFLNGQPVGPAQAEAAPASVASLLQFGGLELRPGQDPATLRRPFSGRLAEVAVYDRLLSEAEITAHAAR